MSGPLAAPELFRGLGLSVDGPATWSTTPRSTAPGLYAVECPAPEPRALLDDRAIRGWLERVPELRLDGVEPTPHDLGERIASFWLADQTVLFLGLGPRSLKGRLAAIYATPLGDRRPYAGGHWLKTLRGLDRARVWWAETDAAEEYLDAALDAFAEAVGEAGRLPFANLSSPGGDHRAHGITDALREPALPPGQAAGHPARSASPPRKGAVSRRTTPGPSRPTAVPGPTRAPRPKPQVRPAAEPTYVSADGLTRARSELAELRDVRRPEVIQRVKTARELGDLRENAEYHAAREEQSFLEGRIQQLEALVDHAIVIEAGSRDGAVALGSRVEVRESDGEDQLSLTIVGPAEASVARGRISYRSPLGEALLGHRQGETVTVRTPGGETRYEILAVA